MAISTLAELKTQIKAHLHRANITDQDGSDNLDNLVLLGEAWVFRNVNAPEMEATLTGTIGSDGTVTKPSDYMRWKHGRIVRTPSQPLKMRPASFIYENFPLRSANGVPNYIAVDGGAFIFGPYPSDTWSIAGMYYAKPASLISTVNSVFTAYPDLYLYSALTAGERFVKNNAMFMEWKMERDAIAEDIRAVNNYARHGTGMAVSPDVPPIPSVW